KVECTYAFYLKNINSIIYFARSIPCIGLSRSGRLLIFTTFTTAMFSFFVTTFAIAITTTSWFPVATTTPTHWLSAGFFHAHFSVVEFAGSKVVHNEFNRIAGNIEEAAQFPYSNAAYHFRLHVCILSNELNQR